MSATNDILETMEKLRLQQEIMMKNQQDMLARIEQLERKSGVSPEPSPPIAAQAPVNDQIIQDNFPDEPGDAKEPVVTAKAFPKKHKVSEEELEFKIGGTWLNRIGASVVILGLIYFLKYSFDNQWIGPTGRILIGVITGLAMLGFGEKLRDKFAIYAYGLSGAGSLALYMSVFAAYNFYHLISPSWAFLFLILVMANTVFTAVRHNALAIGVLGIIGGYLAPLLISTGQPLHWVFFGYLSILTCGILAVSVYKRWDSFRMLSFVFNQLLFASWYASYHHSTSWVPGFSFAVVNFIAYLAIASGYNIKSKSMINSTEMVLIFLNATMFFLWSHWLLGATWLKDHMGFYAAGVALAYIYIGRLAYRLHQADKKQAYTLFAVAIKMITVAIYLQLSHKYAAYAWMFEASGIFYLAYQLKNRMLLTGGIFILVLANLLLPVWVLNNNTLAISWLLEALGFYFMGSMLKVREIQLSGLAVLALGLFAALQSARWDLLHEKQFLLNWPSAAMCLAIAATGVIYFAHKGTDTEKDAGIRTTLGIAALLLIFAFLSMENSHFFRLFHFKFFLSPEQLSLSLVWMIYAASLFFAGIKTESKGLRYGALGLIGIIILKAFLVDLSGLAILYKILLLVILGLLLLGISFVYQKKQNLFRRSDR